MHKTDRQRVVRQLIESGSFHSQTELTAGLAKKGVVATQASVSRDLDEMGVVKIHGIYSLPNGNSRAAEFGPISLQTVGDSLIVVKTLSGLASAVTVRIDSAAIPGVVGTIAGDDTIFIAVADKKSQRSAQKRIEEAFG